MRTDVWNRRDDNTASIGANGTSCSYGATIRRTPAYDAEGSLTRAGAVPTKPLTHVGDVVLKGKSIVWPSLGP